MEQESYIKGTKMNTLTFIFICIYIILGIYELNTKDTDKEKMKFICTDSFLGILVIILNICM